MTPWQILGVAPGSDRKTIKRAYTRLLKGVHPEDHPEAFMRVREAYEAALKTLESPSAPLVFTADQPQAKAKAPDVSDWGASETQGDGDNGQTSARVEDHHHQTAPEPAPRIETDHWADTKNEAARDEDGWQPPAPLVINDDVDDRQKALNRLVAAMSRLLENPRLRNDLARWETLLNGPELQDFRLASAVSHWLLSRVIRLLQAAQDECPLEAALLVLFDDRFQWSTGHADALPVGDDQLFRLCLLIEAAREHLARPHVRVGWRWLAHALLSLSGRLSRFEYLFGLVALMGGVLLAAALTVGASGPGSNGNAVIPVVLLMLYCLCSMVVKRVRDAGVNPILAVIVGVIFPGIWLYFLVAGPKHHRTRAKDPRLKYSPAYHQRYREHFVGSDSRPLRTRLGERFSSIHPGVYLTLSGLWTSGVWLLLM